MTQFLNITSPIPTLDLGLGPDLDWIGDFWIGLRLEKKLKSTFRVLPDFIKLKGLFKPSELDSYWVYLTNLF